MFHFHAAEMNLHNLVGIKVLVCYFHAAKIRRYNIGPLRNENENAMKMKWYEMNIILRLENYYKKQILYLTIIALCF